MTRSDEISRRLKLQQLRVFLAVARTGSMAKAAKHLATSQSVVSKSIAELEKLLGVRLVDRTAQGVEATRYGDALLRRSIAIFDDLKASVGEIEFLADPAVGELRIGTTEPQSGIVVKTIERLSRQYANVNFKVHVGGPALIDRDLRERQIDLVVSPMPNPLGDDLEATPLYRNRLRVVAGRNSPWSRRRRIRLSDLINEPWCAPPLDFPGGAEFVQAFRASGLPRPRVVVECVHNHFCHALLDDGRFLGISSDGYIRFGVQDQPLKVLPVDLAAPPFQISVITLKTRTMAPLAQLFIDHACQITKPLERHQGHGENS
jgi:DNA-binding transcriptional LysR family regulator